MYIYDVFNPKRRKIKYLLFIPSLKERRNLGHGHKLKSYHNKKLGKNEKTPNSAFTDHPSWY